MKFLIPILFLASCATSEKVSVNKPAEKVSPQSFKKQKPLTNAEIADFYQGTAKSINPALQDETIDRYMDAELDKIKNSGDPLLEISLKCSQGNYQEAFKLAAAIFNQYQKVGAYWNQVANCHLNSGSHRKALLFYNKALEVTPNYVPALNNIGVMYTRQGLDQKALVAFERANRESKFSKTPRYNLARLYLAYGLTESALPIFQSLLNEAPGDVDLLNAVGSAHFLMSDYEKAMGYFAKIPQGQWKRPEIGLNISLTLKKLGRTQDARKIFDAVAQPKNAELRKYYASVETQFGGAE